jgi:hypothetical protein
MCAIDTTNGRVPKNIWFVAGLSTAFAASGLLLCALAVLLEAQMRPDGHRNGTVLVQQIMLGSGAALAAQLPAAALVAFVILSCRRVCGRNGGRGHRCPSYGANHAERAGRVDPLDPLSGILVTARTNSFQLLR